MKVEFTPTGKLVAMALLVLAVVGIGVVQWPDALRYIKTEQM